MAAVHGYNVPMQPSFSGASGPGPHIGQQEVVGQRTPFNPTDLSPQFSISVINGRPVNLQAIERPYDPPQQRVTRDARMPRFIALAIEPFLAVAAWPNLNIPRIKRTNWVGMTGARLPMYGPGWGEPRRNIVPPQSVAYGELTALYPRPHVTRPEVPR